MLTQQLSPYSASRLMALWSSGYIKRQHTTQIIGEDLVGRHSWGVALLAMEFFPGDHQLIEWAIVHDTAELVTGDLMAPTKWAHPTLKEAMDRPEREFHQDFLTEGWLLPTSEQELCFKICDLLELAMWAANQRLMGNKLVSHIFNNCENALIPLINKLPDERYEGTKKRLLTFLVTLYP